VIFQSLFLFLTIKNLLFCILVIRIIIQILLFVKTVKGILCPKKQVSADVYKIFVSQQMVIRCNENK
ncbi:hypothetical protein, partial [Priestia megaterium]|uniref:hypothetical protein n=1 Tax=Priestia megaterium TaxID=1404 RepID=UPI002FFF8DFB